MKVGQCDARCKLLKHEHDRRRNEHALRMLVALANLLLLRMLLLLVQGIAHAFLLVV